jgi:hypothetical protein
MAGVILSVLWDSGEIVMHGMDRDHSRVILDFLRKV